MTPSAVSDEARLIRQLWAEGVSLAEIGERLGGLGRAGVQYRAAKLGLGRHPGSTDASPADKDDQLRRLWADGASYRQMADDLGWSMREIEYRVRRLALPRRRNRRSAEAAAETDKAITELYAAGMTVAAIAKELRVSVNRVAALARRWQEQGQDAAPVASAPAGTMPRVRRRGTAPAPVIRAVPAVVSDRPAHPFWSPDRDAMVIATRGIYAALSVVAARLGIPSSRALARYLALGCALQPADRCAGHD